MAKVHKTIEEARTHLSESASLIGPRYKAATAKAEWEEPSVSEQAETNYQGGVAEAIAEGRRQAGIRKVGNAKYRKGCGEKGATVIGTRVTAALGDYAREMAPILAAMNSASDAAPASTRDFRANIANRLTPVVEAAKRAAGKTA